MSKVNLQKFDASVISPNAVVLLVGKRGTGKSTLMKDIMYNMRTQLDFGIAMSPTEDCTSDLASYVPKTCIYNDYNGERINAMLECQRKSIKNGTNRQLFLMLDDCMYDKKVMKGITIRNLFMNGRHRKVFFLNCQQYVMDMPPDLRTNVDYIFALRENIMSNKEKLWKFFFGVFPTFQQFNTVMDACTQNYECLVFNGKSTSTNIEDCIFWYKAARDIPDFSLCKPIYQKMDERYYHDHDEGAPGEKADTGEDANKRNIVTTRNGFTVTKCLGSS